MDTLDNSYIDIHPLLEEVEGNTTICKMLIESFIKDIDSYVNTMNSELNTNNFPALYQVAHKIIPSIRIFNIDKLEPIILELESKLKNHEDLECIKKNIETSIEIFNLVKTELLSEHKSIENAAS
ncbi:hypothetical protein [Aequorivita sp. Q41]|uniref:hypothetical protein n=1 Tax=Aequorivita sp. Q41 TaxID=3153300 RepID=UPI0032420CFA